MGIIDCHICRQVDWKRVKRFEGLGLNEISLKKGHKDFITIVTGRIGEKTRRLAVLKDRKKAVEGLTKKIKVMTRRCYGIFNVNHLHQRIYLALEGVCTFCMNYP